MANYHLYFLKGGLLVGSEDIEAASDNEAARIAEDQGRGDLVEVWNTQSRVRIVKPGGAQSRYYVQAESDNRRPAIGIERAGKSQA